MPIGILGLVLIQIGISILSRLLAPRMPRPKPTPFQSPTTEVGAQLPRGFGIYQTSGVITLVREKRDDQLEIEDGDNKGFVGTVYYAKIQMVCGFGPADILYDVIFDEKALSLQPANKHQSIDGDEPLVVTPKLPVEFSSATQPITLTVAARQMFGGLAQEGGVQGEMRVYPGQPNQVIDPLVADALGDYASRYPHLIHAVFGTAVGEDTASGLEDKWYWGANIGQVRPVSLILGYYPDDLLQDGGKVGQDANWVEVIFKCLTDPIWGKKTPIEKFNLDNWVEHAQAAKRDLRGISDTLVDRSLDDFIDDICTHHEAALVTNPVTGLLELRTARADYDLVDLLQITDENSSDFHRGEAQYVDTINEIKVRFRRFLSSWSDPVVGEVLTEDLSFSAGIFRIFTVAGRNISDVHVYAEGTDPVTAQVELTADVDYKIDAEKGTIIVYNTAATTTHQIITADYVPAPLFSGFVDDVVTAQNLAVRYVMGRQKSETYDYPMFTTEYQAQRKADLLRKTTSRRLAVFQWKMGREGAQLAPLDVVRIMSYGLSNFPVRITKVTVGTLEVPEVTIEAVEDVFGVELATFGPPNLGTGPTTPPETDVPPLAAIYCVDEDTLGVQASDQTYNIEIEEADDTSGTGAVIITADGGVPGDTVEIAITVGKTHRGRHIRGTLTGPWTAWLDACPVGEDPGCVIPTFSVVPDLILGTLVIDMQDPQQRLISVEFRTKSGLLPWSAWAEDDTAPYEASVTLDPVNDSAIEYRIRYYDCNGNEVEASAVVPYPVDVITPPEPPPAGGPALCVDVVFNSSGGETEEFTPAATGLVEFPDELRVVFDTTGYEQVRIQYQMTEGDDPGPVGSFATLECRDKGSTDDAEFLSAGVSSGPAVALDDPTGPPRWSEWVDLRPEAIGDKEFRRLTLVPEDGEVGPIKLRHLRMQFRRKPDDDDDGGPNVPETEGLIAQFLGPEGRILEASEGTGDGELMDSWDLDYASDAEAEADGWTVVKTGGGSITYDTVDTDGNTHVPKFTVVNSGNAYYERVIPMIAGHSYSATVRGRNFGNSGFDTGSRAQWEPGNDTHFQHAAWEDKTVNKSYTSGTIKLQIGRFGGYFGIAGTYWTKQRNVRVYGASDAGGAQMIRWEDQSGNENHADLQGGDTAPTPLTASVQMTGGARLKLPTGILDGFPYIEIYSGVKAAADPNSGQNNIWHLGEADSDYPNGSGNIVEGAGRAAAASAGNPAADLSSQGRIYHVRVSAAGVEVIVDGVSIGTLPPGALTWDADLYIGGGVEFYEIDIFGLSTPHDQSTVGKIYQNIVDRNPDVPGPDGLPPIKNPPKDPRPPLDGSPILTIPINEDLLLGYPPFNGVYGTQVFYPKADIPSVLADMASKNIGGLVNLFSRDEPRTNVSGNVGTFSLTKALAAVDALAPYKDDIADAYTAGVLFGCMTADDINLARRWGAPIPSSAMDLIAKRVKDVLEFDFPCYIRADCITLEERRYAWVYTDGAVCQFVGPLEPAKKGGGSIGSYISIMRASGARQGLRVICGTNMTNAGTGGSGKRTITEGGRSAWWQSAADIRRDNGAIAQAIVAEQIEKVQTCWLAGWNSGDSGRDYVKRTDIAAAFDYVFGIMNP